MEEIMLNRAGAGAQTDRSTNFQSLIVVRNKNMFNHLTIFESRSWIFFPMDLGVSIGGQVWVPAATVVPQVDYLSRFITWWTE